MKNLNFCYIINENKNFQEYLIKSLYSLVKYYKNIGTIYIISTTLFDNEYEILLNKICNNNCILNIKYVNKNIVDALKYPEYALNSKRIDKTALLKFYIPYLVDCNDIIYVDCDILFINNASKILFENITDQTLIKIYYTYSMPNSGIMYINCKSYRSNFDIFDFVINYYNTNNDKVFIDQSCIYEILKKYNDICVVDNSHIEHINVCNTNIDIIDERLKKYGNCILHFINDTKVLMNDFFNVFIRDNNFNELFN